MIVCDPSPRSNRNECAAITPTGWLVITHLPSTKIPDDHCHIRFHIRFRGLVVELENARGDACCALHGLDGLVAQRAHQRGLAGTAIADHEKSGGSAWSRPF